MINIFYILPDKQVLSQIVLAKKCSYGAAKFLLQHNAIRLTAKFCCANVYRYTLINAYSVIEKLCLLPS